MSEKYLSEKKIVRNIVAKNGYYNIIEALCSVVGVTKVETVVAYIKNLQYKEGTIRDY